MEYFLPCGSARFNLSGDMARQPPLRTPLHGAESRQTAPSHADRCRPDPVVRSPRRERPLMVIPATLSLLLTLANTGLR